MAPTKRPALATVNTRITTRSKTALVNHASTASKRKAEGSPWKESDAKRSALGDVTNAKLISNKENKKNDTKKEVAKVVLGSERKEKYKENLAPPPAPVSKMLGRYSLRKSNCSTANATATKPKETQKEKTIATSKKKTRLSMEFEKSGESLYSTALEDIDDSIKSNSFKRETRSSSASSAANDSNKSDPNVSLVVVQMKRQLNIGNHDVPSGIEDFDKENDNDVHQISHYAMDIFNYLKEREPFYKVEDYMEKQVCLTRWMRSLLVDWMVEIQESFELNHETLYLGVKLVDTYLSKMMVVKETLQLVGAAAMFIASKFDERIPPLVDDFLYICDGAYTRRELLRMEITVLKVCNFDLGIPLSYRFLRRYARCAKVTMPTLTLARYILEYSLMDYNTVTMSDSKLASAALYLALQMKKISGWTKTLEFYTGYNLTDFMGIVHLLNNGLHGKPKEQIMTVRNKYSHKIFYEVAYVPLILNKDLKP